MKVNHANLIFHLDTTIVTDFNDIVSINTDSNHCKALPSKIDYKTVNAIHITSYMIT
jgi:hypothetical protein